MPSIEPRRQFLLQFGATLGVPSLPTWAAKIEPSATNAAGQVRAVTTNLTSDNERMISYRHQQHFTQTADGALHLIVNRGTHAPGPGLSLFSSFDGGVTWQFMQNFVSTGDKSTGDCLLNANDLSVVYNDIDGKIMYSELHYDDVARTWSVTLLELAYSSGKWAGLNPALAIDDLGTVWVGFLATARFGATGNIRVVNRVGGGNAWTDPNLVFGPTDKQAVQRSARPVRLPGAVGMVWTVRNTTYWSKRNNGLPDNSAWSVTEIFTGTDTGQGSDPYASHFNVTTDDQRGIHLISIENYDILYFKYDLNSDAWSAPKILDDSRKVAYAQLGNVNGKVATGYSVQRGAGTLTVSSDGGATWADTTSLQLLPIYPGVNYNTARIELPTRSMGAMPILQQYADTASQKLMLFKVPAP